jgi:hypothetical protein
MDTRMSYLMGCMVRRRVLLLSIVAIVVSLLALNSSQSPPPYQYRWTRCIQYLAGGTLYHGQPECEQPPMIFAVGLLFQAFGDGGLQTLSTLLFVVLNASSVCLLLELVGIKNRLLEVAVVLAYCVIVIPPLTYCLATALAVFFVLLALYALERRRDDVSIIWASVLSALALFSKMTSISAIIGILLMYAVCSLPIRIGNNKSKFGLNYDKRAAKTLIRDMSYLVLPLALLVALSLILFPNIVYYTILSHQYLDKLGYLEAVKTILSTNPLQDFNLLLLYCLLSVSGLYYIRFKDPFAIVFAISYVTSFISRFKRFGSSGDGLFTSYYLIFSAVFFILLAGRFISKIRAGWQIGLAAFLLVSSGLFFGDFHIGERPTLSQLLLTYTPQYRLQKAEADRLQAEVTSLGEIFNGYFKLLAKNQGHVLTSPDVYNAIRPYATNMDLKLVDVRQNTPTENRYYDEAYGIGLMYYNLSNHTFEANRKELELARDIEGGKYDLIIMGADAGSEVVYAVMQVDENVLGRYCSFYLPVFTTKRQEKYKWFTPFFSDWGKCKKLKDDAVDYSIAVFQKVCEYDEWSANTLIWDQMYSATAASRAKKLQGSGSPFLSACQSGADLTDRYNKISDFSKSLDDFKAKALALTVLAGYGALIALKIVELNPKNTRLSKRRGRRR